MTRYELLERIGVGGMAEIFRGKAVAAGGFEKPVAIKRILPHLSQDTRFVELLIAEAKVLSLLKHRNIVQIFDVGLGDDGQYFLVMEYVDGKDMGAVQRGLEVRRRRMPFDLALHVGAEVCEALEHAQTARAPDGKQMSLVHRDVSPSNVLLSRAGEVKLTDFGIAKRAEQEATGHGAVRGKFAYISPEQARNEHLEPRSDVFAVGILLWELIANRRLFSGLPDIEALRAVREANVPRLSEIDPRLSSEIDALIMSTLAREARQRPTAGQLGAKLRSLRYSLDVTVGDPATELAKIIDTAEEVERQSGSIVAPRASISNEFDGSEATVIRIQTADAFSMRDMDGTGLSKAREVIDRFEEEETRQAQLSRDQMAFLRSQAPRDSSEMSAPPPLPGVRARRPTDEPTRARGPLLDDDDPPTYLGSPGASLPLILDTPNTGFDADEATRLVAPSSRRTPPPERMRPGTQPPPMPGSRSRSQSPSHTPPPGTVHDRRTQLPAPLTASQSQRSAPSTSGLPGMPPQPMMQPPGMQQPGMQPPMMQPGMQQPGMQQPGMQPGMQQPGMQPPMMQPGMQQPGMQQPGMMQPGMQQPGMMQPGMMQPGMMQPGMQQPGMMQPGMQQPGMMQPGMHGGGYPNWGAQPQPQNPSMFERPVMQRPSAPQVQGFGKTKKPPLKPWILIAGALLMALLAFLVTRACIHTK